MFKDYIVVSQDEFHKTFDQTQKELNSVIQKGEKNIFAAFGFADSIGHLYGRTEKYCEELAKFMEKMKQSINLYLELNPDENVIIASDHGMSTVKSRVDLHLEEKFGKQSTKSYIAYSDSCVMCLWSENDKLKSEIKDYLSKQTCGHLLTEEDRKYYQATDRKFGDFIFILHDGIVFDQNWFGIAIKRSDKKEWGMHGFWPMRESVDQMGSILLISKDKHLNSFYTYHQAYDLISKIMEE